MMGTGEMLIILGVALLLFGPSKLPQLGGAIGESIRNFRRGMGGGDDTAKVDDKASGVLPPESLAKK